MMLDQLLNGSSCIPPSGRLSYEIYMQRIQFPPMTREAQASQVPLRICKIVSQQASFGKVGIDHPNASLCSMIHIYSIITLYH